jgi:hypothetical protein
MNLLDNEYTDEQIMDLLNVIKGTDLKIHKIFSQISKNNNYMLFKTPLAEKVILKIVSFLLYLTFYFFNCNVYVLQISQ